jgi:DNA topoisomerase-3
MVLCVLPCPLCKPPQVSAGRRVVPTELGITLIKGYQRIDPELCRPQVGEGG